MSEPRDEAAEAERIRLKRLAKLSQPASSQSVPQASTSTPLPTHKPKPIPKPTPKRVFEPPAAAPSSPKKRVTATQNEPLDLPRWEDTMLTDVLRVTLNKQKAEESGFGLVWLRGLQKELGEEIPNGSSPIALNAEIADRLMIARLELDANAMVDDDYEYAPVLASLPPDQTVLEYLVGCWKRLNNARSNLVKRGYPQAELTTALSSIDKVRELIISYTGLTMQEPDMFPQPSGKHLGAIELLPSFLALSSLASPLANAPSSSSIFAAGDLFDLFTDISNRFLGDGLEEIMEPIFNMLCFHPSLQRPEGLAGGDSAWRSIVAGLECLVRIKGIASTIPNLSAWCPENATAADLEHRSLMGPLLRLGVYNREWPQISSTYFSDPQKRTRQDVDSSYASLRGTLQNLQTSMFQIFNAMVRASPASREGVLAYFAKVINLNIKRGGMQVDFETVASDSFMTNLHAILLRFAEPFMDAKYTKLDRIDPEYYRHSSRINVSEETRLKATSDEATKWTESAETEEAAAPNFITEVFYLTVAFNHYGLVRVIQELNDLEKEYGQLQRHVNMLNADTSWQGTPLQVRWEAQLEQVKGDMAKIQQAMLSYQVQLTDPEYTFRNVGFTTFLSTWLIRLVDPRKAHPTPSINLPLPKEIPIGFRMLPEYFVEDIVDYYLFLVIYQPNSLDLSGKSELIDFTLTFLSSTWYITNPYLKSKLIQIIYHGTLSYQNQGQPGPLSGILTTHPLALKHLMSCTVSFYIEVESTGTHTQFYDKFETRRHIAQIWKTVWTYPTHRDALAAEANDMEKFVRFVNLMMNDVTYLMDEALSKLTEIHSITSEMEDQQTWAQQPQNHRRERERLLHQYEGSATTYISLGKSTVRLLKEFTAQTKGPFMTPEIVDRLAAMLTYNLDALVGPRCQELKVKNPEKYRFNPRELLGDILQVFINLSDQGSFVKAVAGEGRSYRKELFERGAGIARKFALKSETEIEQLRLFVVKVEEMKATLAAEEDIDGEIPDAFLDPLMYTIMRDPVILPSSKVVVDRSTIKAHLLSDPTDPFNRVPLKLEDIHPNHELKAQIDAFLAERRQKGTAGALGMAAEDVMQIDEPAQS